MPTAEYLRPYPTHWCEYHQRYCSVVNICPSFTEDPMETYKPTDLTGTSPMSEQEKRLRALKAEEDRRLGYAERRGATVKHADVIPPATDIEPIIPNSPGWPSPEAALIFEKHLPEWARLFLKKNMKYRKVRDLGARGIFPDVNRKVGILEDRLWNGQDTPGEPTREVVMDLIGHLFLMLAKGDLDDH